MFSIEYKLFLGPILAVIGCLALAIISSEVLLSFVFKRKMVFTKLFISFIVSLGICGIGVGISLFEISHLTFKTFDETHNVLVRKDVYEYNNEVINCYICKSIDVKIDNTLKVNEIKIEAYSYDYNDILVSRGAHTSCSGEVCQDEAHIEYMSRVDINKLFDRVKNDLKNNELYVYDDYGPSYLIVYVNERNYHVVENNIR